MFIVIKTLFLLVTVTYEVSGYFLSYKCLAAILEFSKEKSLNSCTSTFLTISYDCYLKLPFLSLRKFVAKKKMILHKVQESSSR